MRAIIFPLLAVTALTACEAGTPATATDADFTAAQSAFNSFDALPVTASADLPTAAATYDGKFFGTRWQRPQRRV